MPTVGIELLKRIQRSPAGSFVDIHILPYGICLIGEEI